MIKPTTRGKIAPTSAHQRLPRECRYYAHYAQYSTLIARFAQHRVLRYDLFPAPACCTNVVPLVPDVVVEYGTETSRTIASLLMNHTDNGDCAHRRGHAGRVALRQDFQNQVSRYVRNVSVAAGDGLRVAQPRRRPSG
jgi:hypothetical protein